MKGKRAITIKYILLQAFYWGSLCSVLSYTMTFMLKMGYSSSYIGVLMAITNIGSVTVQSIVANLADRYPKKWSIKRLQIGFVALMFIGSIAMIVIPSMGLALTILIGVAMVSCSAMQPFLNSLAVLIQKRGITLNFGVCRSAGSLGYALVSTMIGKLLLYFPIRVIPISSVILLAGLLISVLLIGNGEVKGTEDIPVPAEQTSQDGLSKSSMGTFEFMKAHKKFVLFLAGVALVFYMHTLISTYMIQIMENVGGNTYHMGVALTIGAILELPTMIVFSRLVGRISCQNLLRISATFFVIKSALVVVAGSVGMVYFAHLFQVGGYALYTPAIVYYVSQLLGEEDMNKGQALATAFATIGSFLSMLFSGWMIDSYSVQTTLNVSLAISTVGAIIMILTVEKFPRAEALAE